MNSQTHPSPSVTATEVVLSGPASPAPLQIRQRTLPLPRRGEALVQMDATAGRLLRPARFRNRIAQDLGALFDLVRGGILDRPVAAQFPLTDIAAAMTLAESRTVQGKIILVP